MTPKIKLILNILGSHSLQNAIAFVPLTHFQSHNLMVLPILVKTQTIFYQNVSDSPSARNSRAPFDFSLKPHSPLTSMTIGRHQSNFLLMILEAIKNRLCRTVTSRKHRFFYLLELGYVFDLQLLPQRVSPF
jgi:hypothetical protein